LFALTAGVVTDIGGRLSNQETEAAIQTLLAEAAP